MSVKKKLKKRSKNKNINYFNFPIETKTTKKNNEHTISACMIVKNEEEFLEKCLSSIKDYVNELIIVDTGSTDNTVEISKKFTDRVYFHPWENSFSKARNQALQYATGDWIFQIDGDEELMKGSGEKIHQTIKKAEDADLILVKIISPSMNGKMKGVNNFERLFRNNGKIHYEGSVHNRIAGGTKAFYSDIELLHYGYDLDETKAEQKFLRTTTLLKKEIENEPDNPLHRHYLSAAYSSRKRYQEAIDEAKRAIDLLKPHHLKNQTFSWTYYIISSAFLSLKQYEQAKKYAFEALEKYPGHMDSYHILTFVASEMGEWRNIIKFGKLFLEQMELFSKNSSEVNLTPHIQMNDGPAVGVLIGHAYHATNDLFQMREYYKKACDMSKTKWKTLWSIVVYHMEKSGDMECAKEYLDLALEEVPERHGAWYMLAEYSKKCGSTHKEINALEKVVETGSNNDFVIKRLLSLYIEKENYEKAYGLLKSSTNITSPSYSDLLKLGNYYFSAGNLEYAINCYMKAAELKPDGPEAWSILAEITLSLGKYEDAHVFLEKALAIKGNDLSNLLTMCELKLKSNDIESHVKYCDKILENLSLDRNRTIDSFEDLKNIFLEIGNSMCNGINYSSKIKKIIGKLDTYITPAA